MKYHKIFQSGGILLRFFIEKLLDSLNFHRTDLISRHDMLFFSGCSIAAVAVLAGEMKFSSVLTSVAPTTPHPPGQVI